MIPREQEQLRKQVMRENSRNKRTKRQTGKKTAMRQNSRNRKTKRQTGKKTVSNEAELKKQNDKGIDR